MRVCYVVESGTDVRMVEGLAARCDLSLLVRPVGGRAGVSWDPTGALRVRTGPASRARFATLVRRTLRHAAADCDAVLVQGYGLAALAANHAHLAGGPPATLLVCSPSEEYYRCRRINPAPGKRWMPLAVSALRGLAQLNARMATRYVVLSRYLERVVGSHGTTAQVHTIPVYGVDCDRFAPSRTPKSGLRQALRLPSTGALLFHASRVAPEKDTPTLIQALGLLRAAGRDVRLLHRSGSWREVARLAERAGLADAVTATDAVHPVHDLPASYQAADVVVQPSLAEGLGFSVLEALACGTPVVASAVGGLVDTVRDGGTGWSVPPRDPEALARAIVDVLDHPQEALRRTDAGRRMVVDRFRSGPAFDSLMAILAGPP